MTLSMKHLVQASFVVAALALCLPVVAQEDTAAVDTATVATAEQQPYGTYLVDAAGMSLYLFMADDKAEGSTCYDACAKAWPPLLTDGEPMVDGMAKAELLGTIQRKNGATQVTYNGWPLYYFVKDDEPGDAMGQDIKGFGAEWYLVTPQGEPLRTEEHGAEDGDASSGDNGG